MKNTIVCLLILAVLLTFAACAADTPANTEPAQTTLPKDTTAAPTTAETTEETTTAETTMAADDTTVCCVITISINPEFALHLNKNGLVLELQCLNEDAQNAIGKANVLGMTGADAVATLLEQIYQHDSSIFSTDQPMVTIAVQAEEGHQQIEQELFRIDSQVETFAQAHQIPLGYQRKSTPVKDPGTTVVSDTIDGNGNRVVVEMDGNGTQWVFISSAETGAMIELIRTEPNGTVTHCYMATNTTVTTYPDGSTTQTEGVIGKG